MNQELRTSIWYLFGSLAIAAFCLLYFFDLVQVKDDGIVFRAITFIGLLLFSIAAFSWKDCKIRLEEDRIIHQHVFFTYKKTEHIRLNDIAYWYFSDKTKSRQLALKIKMKNVQKEYEIGRLYYSCFDLIKQFLESHKIPQHADDFT